MLPRGFDCSLPNSRLEAIRKVFPDTGERWIQDFPDAIEKCLERWQLTLLESVTSGWPTNMIYFARDAEGRSRVLKIGHPHSEMETEVRTLQAYAGRYAVRLLDADTSVSALLLERIIPGTTLRQLASEDANIASAIMLMRDLPQAKTLIEVPSFSRWLEVAFAAFRDQPNSHAQFLTYIEAAEKAFELINSRSGVDYLLHGDLHHENILLDKNGGWLAIDPKGVLGPRIMECGRFLHNFMEDELTGITNVSEASLEDLCVVLERRTRLMAAVLGYDVVDLARVSLIDATLSTCWTINSKDPAGNGLQIVRAVYRLVTRLLKTGTA